MIINQNTKNTSRGRILVAKVGLDGHDRGAKVLSKLLRDGGFEVIYLGVRSTVAMIAKVALQEWVDVVAVSLLSGAHIEVATALRKTLDELGLSHVSIAMGGLIPERDGDELARIGIARSFHPGKANNNRSSIEDSFDELVSLAHVKLKSIKL